MVTRYATNAAAAASIVTNYTTMQLAVLTNNPYHLRHLNTAAQTAARATPTYWRTSARFLRSHGRREQLWVRAQKVSQLATNNGSTHKINNTQHAQCAAQPQAVPEASPPRMHY